MSEFTVKISTDNDAFHDGAGHEVARILEKIAARVREDGVEAFHRSITLFDYNGADVGRAKHHED